MTVGIMVGGHGQVWGSYITHSVAPLPIPATTPTQSLAGSPSPSSLVPTITQVVAGTDLPRAASTRSYLVRDLSLMLTQDKFRHQQHQVQRASHAVSLNLRIVGGELIVGDSVDLSTWLPLLPLATDVHTEAATLTYAQSFPNSSPQGRDPIGRTLRLTLTRAIKAGEIPPLWFSSEVAAQLGLPFLNFSHIREGSYVCPKCNRQFSAPNPLKLHLATRCDSVSPHVLWSRLNNDPSQSNSTPWFTPLLPPPSVQGMPLSIKRPRATKSPPITPKSPLEHSTRVTLSVADGPPSPRTHKQVSPDSTSSLVSTKPSPPRSSGVLSEPRSAFRRVNSHPSCKQDPSSGRYHHHSLQQNPSVLSPGPSHHGLYRPSSITRPLFTGTPPTNSSPEVLINPRLLFGSMVPGHHNQPTPRGAQSLMPVMPLTGGVRPLLTSTPPVDPCAEMETLVSNLGRSRRGHLCLYCGKIYSRKYGLKIHIRTHTGYKPLKCKVCLRPFGDPSNLNKHVRLHAEGETPYRCDHCGKVLVRRRDLDRHVRSRHPELPLPNASSLTDTDEEAEDDDEDDDDEDEQIEEDDNNAEVDDVNDILEVGDATTLRTNANC